jgi:hypothetical protein
MTSLVNCTVEIEPGVVIKVTKEKFYNWASCVEGQVLNYTLRMVSEGDSGWYFFDSQSRIIS